MSRQPWLASYGAIPAHIDPDSHPSIVHLLCAAMQRYAHRPAFTCLGQTLTYAHVDQQSRAFAAYLQNVLRVRKGDRIAVMCPNLMAFPIAMLGIARAGCVQVNVNPLYTPRELEHQLRDAGARVMVIYAGSTATLAAIQDRVELHSIITVAPGDGTAADLPGPPVDAHLHTTTSFARALAEGATLPFAPPVLEGSDLLLLQYTGGTTGLSKGAMLTHRNLVANVEQFKAFVPDALRPAQEVIVTAIPLYHIFALMVNLISYFAVGARNWLVPNPRDLAVLIDVLKAARPSVFMGVNTLYAGLAAHPGTQGVDFSNLRLAGGVAAGKGLVRLGMREVEPALACQQKLAAHRGHGVKQVRGHAALGQHFCRHEPGGATANDGHIARDCGNGRSGGGGGWGLGHGRPLGQRREDGESGCADQNREPCLESGTVGAALAAPGRAAGAAGSAGTSVAAAPGAGVCPIAAEASAPPTITMRPSPVRNAACTTSPGINTDTASR